MIIIDDFVQDKQLLQDIANDQSFFDPGYNWWNGWWKTGDIDTLQHKLITYIWREHTPEQFHGTSISGFEYWTGVYDGSDQTHKIDQKAHGVQGHHIFSLIHHIDKDEHVWNTEQRIVTPLIGTIFYPVPHQCEGGYLRLYDTRDVDLQAPYELIAPKFNRLIIFDPSRLHAVEEVTSGIRKAIAINLWKSPLSQGQMADMKSVI